MAGKIKMQDIVIILPGLMGSELQRHGTDLWAPTIGAVGNLLSSRFRSIQEMEMSGDDPDVDDLGDGFKATRILDDIVIVPSLIKVDGYSGLRNRILDRFDVILGSVHIKAPANYFEFAYDWRRDMRFNARKLKELIDDRLPLWQKHSGAKDARVILIGHSMGGLISRHYLEMLGGWRQCKALITLGSPHRGAVNAAETLSNGVVKFGLDISKALRSLPSMYQILPIYPVIDTGSGVVRLMETDAVPNLSVQRGSTGGVASRHRVT
jgi:pimeloyl-ACP methyl ester carboxylesterase